MKTKIVLLAVFLLACQAALAQNLLTNGDFDSGTTPWYDRALGVMIWISDDGGGPSSNGCIEIGDDTNNGGVAHIESEKVTVVENTVYRIEAWAKVPTGSPATSAYGWVEWLDASDAWLGDSASIYMLNLDGSWHDANSRDITSPAGSVSARVHLGVETANGGTDMSIARWDSVYFGLPHVSLIFADGFENGFTNMWSDVQP